MVLPSSQDEALARYSVSKDVPGSILKCETVLGNLDATPNINVTEGFNTEKMGVILIKAETPGEAGLREQKMSALVSDDDGSLMCL